MTLSNNQKRKMKSAARLYAVQALFQMEASGQTVDAIMREFEDHRFGASYDEGEMAEGDVGLFEQLMQDAVNNQALIDQMTDRALVAKWPIDRIDPTIRALFRAAQSPCFDSADTCMCVRDLVPLVGFLVNTARSSVILLVHRLAVFFQALRK